MGKYSILNKERYLKSTPIRRVSTFERDGVIKCVCVDRIGDNVSQVAKRDIITNTKNNVLRDFIKTAGCKTMVYTRGGDVSYICRYYGYNEITQTIVKEL